MKMFACSCLLFSLIVAALPSPAADQPQNFDADARFAEGNPPLIPHRVDEGMKAADCLSCHWPPGKATLCPHPVRKACTQCHLGSVADAAPQGTASAKKGKGQH